ncbi:alpha-amylase family glycosyl hydrolase [Paraliomyxa miuraensis]|uniref:alpha-amylase family glycosyl hydrolase n=1 Tax=Paraliomyxa miuraensis TaxID=376150 RepID=UPI002252D9A7|nr:alpha-amylase family glycosyl hydrolase [Paraliomyxa miuraensis]MCX4246757.1 alpha-amylase family glycosyl hydrolase [Paraliomyxa miuraensis]
MRCLSRLGPTFLSVAGLLALGLQSTACGSDGLESAATLDPPDDTDGFDPSAGYSSGGTGTGTGGPGSGPDGTGDDGPPPPPPSEGAWDWRDAIIYFVFVDRFHNGDPGNDEMLDGNVADIADWYGGDWEGVIIRIEEGYFNELGVNTLWITVPMDNTSAAGLGVGDPHYYSGYHGYWPSDLESTEEHFGTLEKLQELVTVAHDHDLKVIFDYAMNHVHADSPVHADNPGWFWPNDNGFGGNCVCGSGCSWDGDEGKRCWFTDYLPDFDFTNAAARDFSVSNALWWAEQTGADGFRLDAVKHIDDSWLLELRNRSNTELDRYDDDGNLIQRFYMVGETFTGDQGQIAYYVNDEMLDGQFDFPIRTKIVENVLMRQGSMSDLAGFMDANDGFYWSGAVMSTFIGNHDLPRVVHYAEDDPLSGTDPWWNDKDLGWNSPPGVPGGTSAFERLVVGFGIILTTPGAPLLYYGDEIGMAGAGDPDNRRPMDWNTAGYTGGQQLLLQAIKDLNEIRAEHPAMRYGTRTTLDAGLHTFSYRMDLAVGDPTLDETVYVAINRDDGTSDVGGLPDGGYLDELSGDGVTVSGGTVSVPPRSLRILVAR